MPSLLDIAPPAGRAASGPAAGAAEPSHPLAFYPRGNKTMPSVMIVAWHRPDYSSTGSTARLATVVEHLHARGLQVNFLHVTRRRERLSHLPVVRRCINEVQHMTLRDRPLRGIVPKLVRMMARKASRSSMFGMRRWYNKWRPPVPAWELMAEHVQRWQPDIIWVDHTWMAGMMTGVRQMSAARWVVDTHDVLHTRDASRRQAGLDGECDISREDEIELLRPFDLVLAIQGDEQRTLSGMLPGKQVVTLGHAISVEPQRSTRPAVSFVGSKIDVNQHGLMGFIHQAWPEVQANCPAAKLEVSGSVCQMDDVQKAAAGRGSNIVLRGIVPQVRDIYDGPAVSICPLWAGSGLKIKMVEALAYGKAIVTTPVGSEGLEDGIDRSYILAPTPRDFIEPVTRALTDAAYRAHWEGAAAEYARRRFAPARIWSDVDAVLENWLAPQAARRSA